MSEKKTVAVVGAGPAGLYAARKLAKAGVHVIIINRDLKPGGLAEYGIYPTKHKMKEGLRKQFHSILSLDNVDYYGGVSIGNDKPINLKDLDQLGFAAQLFTVGAQGTKMLGIDGEEGVKGIYCAKDLVYHYNQLPPFSEMDFPIGKRVGIIGMGNVMVDIAHWLVTEKKVDEVVIIARRGPAERAYTDKEMRAIAKALDLDDLTKEFARIEPQLLEVGQNPDELYKEIIKPMDQAKEIDSPTKVKFRFLSSPKKILANSDGWIEKVVVEHNKLVPKGDKLRPQGLGITSELELDTLIYAIGDQVDPNLGLPYEWGKYIVAPGKNPRDPNRPRYEVYDPEREEILKGKFVAGWARSASDGLVGKARSDGETAAEEVLYYLENESADSGKSPEEIRQALEKLLSERGVPIFTYQHVKLLTEKEREEAKKRGLEFFKFSSNAEMLRAVGLES